MIEYKDFENILFKLIELNHQNRDGKEARIMLSPQQWAYEYGTINCNIGRQTGKTRFITENCTVNDVIIVPNHQMKKQYLQYNVHAKLMTAAELMREQTERIHRLEFDTIYVDEPFFVFNQIKPALFYDALVHGYGQTFIFLGTQ